MVGSKVPTVHCTGPHDFNATEARALARIAQTDGWDVAAHDYMRELDHHAYRLAVDEYAAQLRFLLPLGPTSRVLIMRSGWGAVPLNLASCTALTVAMDDRRSRVHFLASRQQQATAEHLAGVAGRPAATLPFVDGAFDAVILLDAFETIFPDGRQSRRPPRVALLEESRRILRQGGSLLLGTANRLGFARPPTGPRARLQSYWSYRRTLRRAGFADLQFFAPLPSHREPFFILPLDQWRLLNHFVDGLFTAQDYRFKLQARGLGPAYRLARVLWSVARRLRLTGIARYIMPSYLIVCHT